ncbi:hypothetical protein FQZ97_657920 [compost metagenome]
MAASSVGASNGLPAQASQARRGNVCSQSGNASKRLADRRSNSSCRQRATDGGRARRRLPASISFCMRVQSPRVSGSASIALSVRISQRSEGGSASAGTWAMRLALKPTMSSWRHWPRDAGSSAKRLSEQNSTRSRCSWPRSSGSALSALPVRFSVSRVSASAKISRGNSVSPHERSSRRAPASRPARSSASVFDIVIPRVYAAAAGPPQGEPRLPLGGWSYTQRSEVKSRGGLRLRRSGRCRRHRACASPAPRTTAGAGGPRSRPWRR